MPMQPAIVAKEVSYAFGSGALRQQVLSNVSLRIESGEIIVLTGPSGSGKTTLLTLCGALRTMQQGSLSVLGQELHGASVAQKNAARHRMGFIFQAHHLLNALTAVQNVALALGVDAKLTDRERRARAAEMLEAVGLGHRLDYYPEELSGGQKQRVAVARALVRKPGIVLADEPTASLDRKSGRETIELLLRIARTQDAAIVLVTHDVRVMDIADRTIHLEDGVLVEQGILPSVHRNQELADVIRMAGADGLENWVGALSHAQLGDALDRLGPAVDAAIQFKDVERGVGIVEVMKRLLHCVIARILVLVGGQRAELERFDLLTLQHEPFLVLGGDGGGFHELDLWLQGREGQMVGRLRLMRSSELPVFVDRDVEVVQSFEKGIGLLFDLCLKGDA